MDVSKILFFSFQFLAFIAAIITWKEYRNTNQKFFIYYLGYVLLTEIIGYILPTFNLNNKLIYNLFLIVTFSFFLYWFNLIIKRKKWVIIFFSIFIGSLFISFFYENFLNELLRIPLTTGTILILICSGLFYFELLKKDEAFNYLQSQKFWIVTGLLIFYIGFLPLQLLMPYIDTGSYPFQFAITSLNIILYGLFTYSFLWAKNN